MNLVKLFFTCLLLTGCMGFGDVKHRPENSSAEKFSFYELNGVSISGDEISFESFKGKKVLIVNTASECGFTPQYEELQKFHEKYGDSVKVLGFPSNQFGGQEPGSNEDIASFCRKNYGVSFTMMEKTEVKGNNKNKVYKWLSDPEQNGWNSKEPTWNFCKYLIDSKGKLIGFYGSSIKPFDPEIIKDLSK